MRNSRGGAGILLIVLAAVVVLIGSVMFYSKWNVDSTATCTIARHDTITKVENGNSKTEKRISTKDCGVFTVNDSYMKGKTRSADLYAQIEDGKRYTLKYNGFRSGILSLFPNITEATEAQ